VCVTCDRLQAALDDMTERCRTAERRGWDAAVTYCVMYVKSQITPSRTLPDTPGVVVE
jgi:hypothetical protein